MASRAELGAQAHFLCQNGIPGRLLIVIICPKHAVFLVFFGNLFHPANIMQSDIDGVPI